MFMLNKLTGWLCEESDESNVRYWKLKEIDRYLIKYQEKPLWEYV
jgi:hypothetical protein